MLGWPGGRGIDPRIPVWDKGKRDGEPSVNSHSVTPTR